MPGLVVHTMGTKPKAYFSSYVSLCPLLSHSCQGTWKSGHRAISMSVIVQSCVRETGAGSIGAPTMQGTWCRGGVNTFSSTNFPSCLFFPLNCFPIFLILFLLPLLTLFFILFLFILLLVIQKLNIIISSIIKVLCFLYKNKLLYISP